MTATRPDLPAPPVNSTGGGARWRRAAAASAVVLVLLVAAGIAMRGRSPAPALYVGLSMLLFATGVVGVLIRRNALVLFMCIELMLNAVNLAFVTFSRMTANIEGQAIVLFVMIVAAAEVAVGLAIVVSIFRRRHSANVDDLNLLRW